MSGESLTPTIVNDSSFGMRIRVENDPLTHVSSYLIVTNFAFDIRPTATIQGVEVIVERKRIQHPMADTVEAFIDTVQITITYTG